MLKRISDSGVASGMTALSIVWLGQLVSVLATTMTGFAQTIWVFQKTGSATALAGMQVAFILPFLLLSPIAGVLVDRYNRKLMMMLSDLAAVLATAAVLILVALGKLEVWHLYAAAVVQGLGNTFQWPAFSAAISVMVPKEQYGRANGMMSLVEAGPGVFGPLMAGALLPFIGLLGILVIDVATFFLAIGTLLIIRVPQPRQTTEGAAAKGNLLTEAVYGFKYIFSRPSLLGLQMVFFFGNLFAGMAMTLAAPMILSRTANNSIMLGTVQSAGALAAVVGGIAISVWGGFKRRVHGVLLGWLFSSLGGYTLFGLGTSLVLWIPGAVLGGLFGPLVNSSNQAIWQAKVAPDVQGRVFSARRLIAWLTNPISPIIAGTMADYVLEPAMQGQTALASMFGGLFGTGPGAGMGLMISLCGIGGALVGLAGYLIPAIRDAEDRLPDHDQDAQAASPTAA